MNARIRVIQEGCTDDEISETLSIALIVGSWIVIPEMRKAVDDLFKLREKQSEGLPIDEIL